MKRARLTKEQVKSYLTVCKLQEMEEDYPHSGRKIDLEKAKLTYLLLITTRNCLTALLHDVGAAIERQIEKEGKVGDPYIELIREQN